METIFDKERLDDTLVYIEHAISHTFFRHVKTDGSDGDVLHCIRSAMDNKLCAGMHESRCPECEPTFSGLSIIRMAVDTVLNETISCPQPRMSPAHEGVKMVYDELISLRAAIATFGEKLKL